MSQVGCAAGRSEPGRCQFQFWLYFIACFYNSTGLEAFEKHDTLKYSLTMNFLAANQMPPCEPQIYFVYFFSPF